METLGIDEKLKYELYRKTGVPMTSREIERYFESMVSDEGDVPPLPNWFEKLSLKNKQETEDRLASLRPPRTQTVPAGRPLERGGSKLLTDLNPQEFYETVFHSTDFVGAQPLQYLGHHTVEILRHAKDNPKNITFSPKLDGKRYLCLIRGRKIALIGRNIESIDFEDSKLSKVNKKTIVLDVEVVEGLSNKLSIFAFDILVHDGQDVRGLTYTDRRNILDTKYKTFNKKLSAINFYVNESYSISKLTSYKNLVSNVFWKSLRASNLGFDGVIFYDGRYRYPLGDSPAHYGTWKWKPRDELTIDLRIFNKKATFPSRDWKTKKVVWNSITETFPDIKSVYLLKKDNNPFAENGELQAVSIENYLEDNYGNIMPYRNQEENQSYEFNLVESGNKLDLVGKMSRDKNSNKYMTIDSTIIAFREDIGLENIADFYTNFFVNKNPRDRSPLALLAGADPNKPHDPRGFPEYMLRRLAFVSMVRDKYNIRVDLPKHINSYTYYDYLMQRGESEECTTRVERLKVELNRIVQRIDDDKDYLRKVEKQIYNTQREYQILLENEIKSLNSRKIVQEGDAEEIDEATVRDLSKVLEDYDRDIHAATLESGITRYIPNWDEKADELMLGKKAAIQPFKLNRETGTSSTAMFQKLSGYTSFIDNVPRRIKNEKDMAKTREEELNRQAKIIQKRIEEAKKICRANGTPLFVREMKKMKVKQNSKWYYVDNPENWMISGGIGDDVKGPFSNDEMRKKLFDGTISKDTLIQDRNLSVRTYNKLESIFPIPKNAFVAKEYLVQRLSDSTEKEYVKFLRKIQDKADKGKTVAYIRFDFGSKNAQIFNKLITYCPLEVTNTLIHETNRLRVNDTEFEVYENPKTIKDEICSDKLFNCKLQLIEGKRRDYRLPRYRKKTPHRIYGKRHPKSYKIMEPRMREGINWYYKPETEIVPHYEITIYRGPHGLRLWRDQYGRYNIEMEIENLKVKKTVKKKIKREVEVDSVVEVVANSKNILPLLNQVV